MVVEKMCPDELACLAQVALEIYYTVVRFVRTLRQRTGKAHPARVKIHR